jgi:hypothetical protein
VTNLASRKLTKRANAALVKIGTQVSVTSGTPNRAATNLAWPSNVAEEKLAFRVKVAEKKSASCVKVAKVAKVKLASCVKEAEMKLASCVKIQPFNTRMLQNCISEHWIADSKSGNPG